MEMAFLGMWIAMIPYLMMTWIAMETASYWKRIVMTLILCWGETLMIVMEMVF